MFMFRSRRATLTKRLLKARRRRGAPDDDGDGVMVLLKQLQENQLGMLWTAVESRGRDGGSNCVLMPRDRQPHVLCCQTWRWPDLLQSTDLKRLPACRFAGDPVYVCCNPYHWSRVYQPDTPPPPYSKSEKLDRAPSENPLRQQFHGSLTTNGEDSLRNPSEWCRLAYWELAQRVGPLFPVEAPAVNVFGDVPYCDGLSLETLAQQNCNAPESVRHGRCKIGLGVTLSHEGGSVWVYNRSENPIFVNSVTLDSADSPLPTRVPAEQCLCVYDPQKAAAHRTCWDFSTHGPIDPNSIRISFAKGWGPLYKRQEITSCPCWLEILLAPCR
ncbi:daughters against dpp [Tribolium castaneum]|uniref:Mothers against decapentaplegic homolog n=2 Tax=Tribolium castaneum TaxID=7070 RepID=D6WB20_TRICA|nr:daughters against dpp [Tribolium castaneum]EEZ99343.2 daughters against dpp [Tribolium castaneum]|eukprot:NP_001139378.1 daughters against dpp [Tribolium castaneum]